VILYFDNLITDEPLIKGLYSESVERRNRCPVYKIPSKLDITMYMLQSYAELEWSHVIIKYGIADANKAAQFEAFVKRTFPNAEIIRGRSDNQKKFQETIAHIAELGDEWVFYAGNVDHPFVDCEPGYLNRILEALKAEKKEGEYISAYVSHCMEMLSFIDPQSVLFKPDWVVLKETDEYFVVRAKDSLPLSTQLVHISLLRHLAFDYDYGDKKIVRITDGVPIKLKELVFILPKKEFCEHFDGYSHSNKIKDVDTIIPPLFIPQGFFEGKMKIRAYYPDYKDGWVNVNPAAGSYIFEKRENPADLKTLVEKLPYFWRNRIETLDANPSADSAAIKAAYDKDRARRLSAWRKKGALDGLLQPLRAYGGKLKFMLDHPEQVNLESGNPSWVLAKKTAYKVVTLFKRPGGG
jgi:hypothetical protein